MLPAASFDGRGLKIGIATGSWLFVDVLIQVAFRILKVKRKFSCVALKQ